MDLRVGSRLKSSVCDTEIIVVRAPKTDVDLRCGGVPMRPLDVEAEPGLTLDPAQADGTALGKRYAEEEVGLEILSTKGGKGSLTVGEVRLPLKEAKPLPASD
jgi:hypothetical protein